MPDEIRLVFGPEGADPLRWDPLNSIEIDPSDDGLDAADYLSRIVLGPSSDEFLFKEAWTRSNARLFLTGLILHVRYSEQGNRRTMMEVARLVRDHTSTLTSMRTTLHRPRFDRHAPYGITATCDGAIIYEVHPGIAWAAEAFACLSPARQEEAVATLKRVLWWCDEIPDAA
ncbi:MAG: hypothetical protein ACYDD1_02720 [Caulobacteraceae bacterium]